jgi:protein-S-isoprenylcysteine O-methyltransferase Ste14
MRDGAGDDRGPRVTLLKTLLFTALVPGTAAGLVPWLLRASFPGATFVPVSVRALGACVLAAGVLVYGWCALEFSLRGGGTPAPIDPPERLSVRGLYRLVRNPMYVGVLLVVLGQAAFFASLVLLAYAAAVFMWFHLFVILYEEPNLTKRFGRAYERYRSEVPRWVPNARRH